MNNPRWRLAAAGFLFVVTFAARVFVGADDSASDAQRGRTIAVLEQAVKTDPNNADLWVHIGFAHRKTGDLERSRGAFEKAASLDPKNQDALYMLGLIYESQRRNADALRVWKQYLGAVADPGKRSVAESHIHQLSQ